MHAGLSSAYHEPAVEEFLVMQFLHSAFRFFDGLHLHEGESLRTLVVPITYDLRVLDVPDAIKQFEEIALGGVEG